MPDPAAVGQYMRDAAEEMVKRGWAVEVLTANRGYDNPSLRYPRREVINGVYVKRLPFSSLGKRTLVLRLLAAALFMLQVVVYGLRSSGLTGILVSTSPPMCSLAAVVVSIFRRVPVKYWVMDVNPDQLIELGQIKSNSLTAKMFNLINRSILSQAEAVVTLDRFMAQRLNKKLDIADKMKVIAPWPLREHHEAASLKKNRFRCEYGLEEKFIVMYSGNHTTTNSVTTLLQAALELQKLHELIFMFIGGGLQKHEVDDLIADRKPTNIISLPYQPLEKTADSLAAADVQVVSIGERFVGVVHPSKIYGALAVGRPILLLGPIASPAGKVVCENEIGWQLSHGDVSGAVELLRKIKDTPTGQLDQIGRKARQLAEMKYNRGELLNRFCDIIE